MFLPQASVALKLPVRGHPPSAGVSVCCLIAPQNSEALLPSAGVSRQAAERGHFDKNRVAWMGWKGQTNLFVVFLLNGHIGPCNPSLGISVCTQQRLVYTQFLNQFTLTPPKLVSADLTGVCKLFNQFITNFRFRHSTVQSTSWPPFVAKMIDTIIYTKGLYSKDRSYNNILSTISRYTVFNMGYVSQPLNFHHNLKVNCLSFLLFPSSQSPLCSYLP